MFQPISTTHTACKVEVSVYEGRYVADGEEVGSLTQLMAVLEERGCPIPFECTLHTADVLAAS